MDAEHKRWISWAGASVLVAALVAWAFWPRAVSVDVAPVTRGSFVVTLDEEGETRVRERFEISAPVAGRLRRIELDPGDAVVAGETVLALFQPRDAEPLDPRSRAEAEASVRAMEAEVERARHERDRAMAEGEFAKKQCERERFLTERGIVSKEAYELAELEERRAAENLDVAEHAVESAVHRLASAQARALNLAGVATGDGEPIAIRSPVDGVVLQVLRESESVVAAGDPLLQVGDAREIEIVADYLSRDAVRIRPGARVMIDRWGGDGMLTGQVRRVDPSGFTKISALGVEEQRVNVVIDLDSPFEERPTLADGFRVETRIVVSACDDVIQVPAGSLFRRGDAWGVFVMQAGRARMREVEVGARTPTLAEIVSGLETGEQVILYPGDELSEGVRVGAR